MVSVLQGSIALSLRDFLALLRSRWLTICLSTLIGAIGAVLLTHLTPPTYVAYTRLFVATPRSGSVSDLYEGDLFTKERVVTYAELLKGQNIAQRTIDKLHLDMSAGQLRSEVTPVVARDTILIYLYISDESAVRARDIANTMSDELVLLVDELENPPAASSVGVPGRVVIEQSASLPQKPNKPNGKRNLLAGLALGMLAGTGAAVLRASLDDRLKKVADLEEITDTDIVGMVPRETLARGARFAPLSGDGGAGAEEFRVIRTNLTFLDVDRRPRQIVVASPTAEDGRTTVAVGTAVAFAAAGANVVIVDGDLRQPAVAEALDISGDIGLSAVISGEAALRDALQETGVARLTALTAGPVPPNPSELLGSPTARETFEALRAQFDYVIIDSAPLKTATDAAVLAAASDGVLLVARLDRTAREDLKSAVSRLSLVGASIIGAVVNGVPRGAARVGWRNITAMVQKKRS